MWTSLCYTTNLQSKVSLEFHPSAAAPSLLCRQNRAAFACLLAVQSARTPSSCLPCSHKQQTFLPPLVYVYYIYSCSAIFCFSKFPQFHIEIADLLFSRFTSLEQLPWNTAGPCKINCRAILAKKKTPSYIKKSSQFRIGFEPPTSTLSAPTLLLGSLKFSCFSIKLSINFGLFSVVYRVRLFLLAKF